MNTELLRKMGLTDGEIRVYKALAYMGRSSTGPIMDKSGISSSKVYLILERLMQKGLVSFVSENNVKKFQVANPQNILEYLNEKQKELDSLKEESKLLIEDLKNVMGKYEEESAQIYKGYAGLRVAFTNLVDELGRGEEFLFFSQSEEELTNEKVVAFFRKLHQKRVEKGIVVKGIADISLKPLFTRQFMKQRDYHMKFFYLTLPSAISIGKKRIIMNIWEENPICFEIISERIAQGYREFFYKMWGEAK